MTKDVNHPAHVMAVSKLYFVKCMFMFLFIKNVELLAFFFLQIFSCNLWRLFTFVVVSSQEEVLNFNKIQLF